jgi:membrane peptidoglycan carboxypeptidase
VILNDPAFGPDVATRRQLLYRGGLTITTTLDPRRQTLAQEAVNDRVAPDDSSQVGVALSSVDSTNGQIVAMAQNRTFDPSPDAPPGFGALNYNVDKIYGGGLGFQPGSTYKPFTLATWLSSGRSLNDVVNADRRSYNVARFHARCDDGTMGGRYSPANAEGSNKGNITVMQATYGSVNTAYMQMAYKLDLCDIRDTAASLGVHRADGQPLIYYPSAVLGTNEIAPLTMASAYGGFANGGIYCSPIAIISVTDAAGKVLPKPEANCHEVLDPDVVASLNSALQQVLVQGTARGTYIGRPAAGKTGTTNDSTETWFTGYTAGGLSTAVWVGTPNPEPSSLNGIRINGRYHGRVYGATLALPTWKAYMRDAVEGMEVKSFAEASQDAEAQHQVTVPRVIGKTEDEAREAIQSQDLADGPLVLVDSAEPAGTIIGTSPRSGSRVTIATDRHRRRSGRPVRAAGPSARRLTCPGRRPDRPTTDQSGPTENCRAAACAAVSAFCGQSRSLAGPDFNFVLHTARRTLCGTDGRGHAPAGRCRLSPSVTQPAAPRRGSAERSLTAQTESPSRAPGSPKSATPTAPPAVSPRSPSRHPPRRRGRRPCSGRCGAA